MAINCVKFEYEDYGLCQSRYFSSTRKSYFYPHSYLTTSKNEPNALASKVMSWYFLIFHGPPAKEIGIVQVSRKAE